jgi:hypothetical protein
MLRVHVERHRTVVAVSGLSWARRFRGTSIILTPGLSSAQTISMFGAGSTWRNQHVLYMIQFAICLLRTGTPLQMATFLS